MSAVPGGAGALAEGIEVARIGFGAMRLGEATGGGARDAALEVLRAAAELGVTHVDTADFYGIGTANALIREALAPYPAGLHVATKAGVRRDDRGRLRLALGADDLRRTVEANLQQLGLDVLDVVNLRVGRPAEPAPGSLGAPFEALTALRAEGLIRHLGVSNVTAEQVAEARAIAPVACVQNRYGVLDREDDPLVDVLAAAGIAYVPYSPLGGATPRSEVLDAVGARVGASPAAVALAWSLHRSPNVLAIPGTSSVAHLRENVAAADLVLPEDALLDLEGIAG